jgi:hypothetical protein
MEKRRSKLLGATRGKFGYLLVALIALLVTAPVMAEGWAWRALITSFVAGVLMAGLYVVRPGRPSLIAGAILAAVEFTIGRFAVAHPARWLILAQIILWLVALLYVTVSILERVLDSDEVTLETLQAAFCVYLLLGLFWVYVFAFLRVTVPDSFRVPGGQPAMWSDEPSRRMEFMRLFVFGYATLTGTGLGDLEPSNGFANMAASLEAMSAQVYLAVVIARLVGVRTGSPATGRAEAISAPPTGEVDPSG